MYITERILSLLIFSLVLVLICCGIANSKLKVGKKLITLYILILGIMGYCFIPHMGADLTRLLITMKFYTSKGTEGLYSALLSSSTPGTGLYFYIIGKTGNDHLLPAISAVITYSFCFSILKREYNNYETRSLYIAVMIFAFMSRGLTMQIISNIRTLMALSICAWCVYKEFCKKEKTAKFIIFYLIAASIHIMGQVILLYRIVYFVIDKGKNYSQKVVRTGMAVIFGVLIWVLGNKYISEMLLKTDYYFSYAQSGTSYNYIWERVLSIMSLILVIYLLVEFKKCKKKLEREGKFHEEATVSLTRYLVPLIIMDILIMPIEFNFFQRLSWFLTIMTMPLGMSVLRMGRHVGINKIIINNILIYSVFMLALACVRGDLCSLKFFPF